MAKIGYAAMLEQFAPGEVLDLCARAESAGFSAILSAYFLYSSAARGYC